MLGYHSANASICRTDRSRQKQDFQDFQNPSIIPATSVPVPYGFDLPLSSAQISSKSIQDIEIQYDQNFYKDSCLSSNDVEFPNQDSKLLPSSAWSSEDESGEDYDSEAESEIMFHPVLFQRLADSNFIIKDSKQMRVDVCSVDPPNVSEEPKGEVADHSMSEFMELMKLFPSEEDEEVLSDLDLDDFQISMDRIRDGVPFDYAADMASALGVDDETLNIPADADLVCGEGLEQRITRSMAKAFKDVKHSQ